MDDVWSVGRHVAPVEADDGDLARAAVEDREAFAVIYERYRVPVYRYLRSRTASDDDAEELTAVTFERALRAIHRFRPAGGGMAAWLLRISRNAHLDRVRSGARAAMTHIDPTPSTPADDDVVLRSLVDALPASQRDAIQLRFAAGLTAREIGQVLGTTEGAAQKQIERGLKSLKEAYGVD
jgi:RNA polymerase sigma-70 factor (ECF subfamily)